MRRVAGYAWVNNDVVNGLATAAACVLAAGGGREAHGKSAR